MSFNQRVATNVNITLKKTMSNAKKIKNQGHFKTLIKTLQLKEDFIITTEGENYTKYRQLRTTKASMKKNNNRIDEVKQYLNFKYNKNISLEELSGFIAYIICNMPDTIEIQDKLYPKKSMKFSPISSACFSAASSFET